MRLGTIETKLRIETEGRWPFFCCLVDGEPFACERETREIWEIPENVTRLWFIAYDHPGPNRVRVRRHSTIKFWYALLDGRSMKLEERAYEWGSRLMKGSAPLHVEVQYEITLDS